MLGVWDPFGLSARLAAFGIAVGGLALILFGDASV